MSKCDECGEPAEHNLELCEECCDHSDVDFPCCLICGKDMFEELAAYADHMRDSMEDR